MVATVDLSGRRGWISSKVVMNAAAVDATASKSEESGSRGSGLGIDGGGGERGTVGGSCGESGGVSDGSDGDGDGRGKGGGNSCGGGVGDGGGVEGGDNGGGCSSRTDVFTSV